MDALDTARNAPAFDFGRVFGRGVAVYGKNFLPFTAVAVATFVPVFLWVLLTLEGVLRLGVVSFAALAILTLLASQVVSLVLFHASIESLRHRPVSIGRSFGAILPRLFPALGVALVGGILTGIGMMLLVVPGLIFLTMWWVAIPVTLVETTGVVDSLRRSWDLIEGHGWTVFGVIFVFWIVDFATEKIITRLFESGDTSAEVYLILPAVLSIFLSTASAACTAVGYNDLRRIKDGVETDEIAAVFD